MGGCLGKPEPGPSSNLTGSATPAAANGTVKQTSGNEQQVQVPTTASSDPVPHAATDARNGDITPAASLPATQAQPGSPAATSSQQHLQAEDTKGSPSPSLNPDGIPGVNGVAHQQADEADNSGQNGALHKEADDARPKTSDVGLRPAGSSSQEDNGAANSSLTTQSTSSTNPVSTWDKAKMLFTLMRAEELLNDLHDLKYIGAGGYGKVFKAVWRSAPVAVKLVPSHSSELFKSSSYKEALLCKELCHPNIVQTYETRCAQLTEEFVHSILVATETPLAQMPGLSGAGASGSVGAAQSYGSQEFVSGDGFGLPSPVPDMVVRGRTLPEAAAKWKDILFTTGAKAGDFLTVIIMDFCDYGSLVRPIVKGMFRPFSASGSDREARVRYRALLRTAKEIAQGLEHLHHLRVVHGDLKPGNVLLKGSRVDVRGFNAQVIDFGLSHMVQNSNPQKVSKAGGTLVYAAPEVFSGRVGKAADVYSLGIILWEMVTGSQPYKDLAEGQIVLGVQKGGLRPAWPPGQLPQLQELYERCVAQDPEARPKAKEVVQFLTQIEMDLRAELRAAHKQMQQQQQLSAAQQQAEMAAMQQQAAALHHQQQAMALQQQQQQLLQQAQQQAAVGRVQ